MNEQYTISTPEQVSFHYETAGIGSRSLGALLDSLIIFTVLFLMDCALLALLPAMAVSTSLSGDESSTAWGYVVAAAIVLVQFLFFWGYYVFFEIVWRGSTPGKRAARLRVMRRDGQPIGAGEAVIRNLVRLIDFLPIAYGIGLISMFVDKDARRLGDFAAGTIVVKEADLTTLRDVRLPDRPIAAAPAYAPQPYAVTRYPYIARNPHSTVQAPRDPLPGISVRDVTPEDYRLIREVIQRVGRGELEYDRGQELARQLAHGVAQRMGFDFADWQRRGWEPVTFLQSVLYAHDVRGE
jgi:uncharacterized RDD family membrane protein YckC